MTNDVLDVDIIVSQKLSNLCLYWRCWKVQTIAAGLLRENIFGLDEMNNLRKSISGDTVAAEWEAASDTNWVPAGTS